MKSSKNLFQRALAARKASDAAAQRRLSEKQAAEIDHVRTNGASLLRIVDELTPIVCAEALRLEPTYQKFVADEWPDYLAANLVLWPNAIEVYKNKYTLPLFEIDFEQRSVLDWKYSPMARGYAYAWIVSPILTLTQTSCSRYFGGLAYRVGSFCNLNELAKQKLLLKPETPGAFDSDMVTPMGRAKAQAALAIASKYLLELLADGRLSGLIKSQIESRIMNLRQDSMKK